MIFAPDDYGTNLGAATIELAPALTRVLVWALITGEESPQELLEETRRLLHSVDAATTVAMNQLMDDEDITVVARHWAFFGPGIFRRLEVLSKIDCLKNEDLVTLAGANAFLTARKLTLQLNGIDVSLVAPA